MSYDIFIWLNRLTYLSVFYSHNSFCCHEFLQIINHLERMVLFIHLNLLHSMVSLSLVNHLYGMVIFANLNHLMIVIIFHLWFVCMQWFILTFDKSFPCMVIIDIFGSFIHIDFLPIINNLLLLVIYWVIWFFFHPWFYIRSKSFPDNGYI